MRQFDENDEYANAGAILRPTPQPMSSMQGLYGDPSGMQNQLAAQQGQPSMQGLSGGGGMANQLAAAQGMQQAISQTPSPSGMQGLSAGDSTMNQAAAQQAQQQPYPSQSSMQGLSPSDPNMNQAAAQQQPMQSQRPTGIMTRPRRGMWG